MDERDTDTARLMREAEQGDPLALTDLLARHRERLRRMVNVHMDQRLRARVDPSDVVQEALADAYRQMSEYLAQRPIPFYPWLRQIAWNRLIDLHRRHLKAQKRTILREAPRAGALPDHSLVSLAAQLLSPGTSPSGHAVRAEVVSRTRSALASLPERDREILILRYLERLPTPDIAAVTGASEGAVRVRHLRALRRIRDLLEAEAAGE